MSHYDSDDEIFCNFAVMTGQDWLGDAKSCPRHEHAALAMPKAAQMITTLEYNDGLIDMPRDVPK